MSKEYHGGEYFCGNKISDYGLENGYLDYRTLAESFDGVLNNDIIPVLSNAGFYFDIVQGGVDNNDKIFDIESQMEEIRDTICYLESENQEDTEEYKELLEELEELGDELEELENENGELPDIYQYIIIDNNGYETLSYWLPEEVIFYCEQLDMYVWGVDHWGTSWDYVLTSVKLV